MVTESTAFPHFGSKFFALNEMGLAVQSFLQSEQST